MSRPSVWIPWFTAVWFIFSGRLFPAEVNLALTGTASQSSTGYGGDASRAIDGNTDGNYGAGSITHTADNDPAPFWQVDLGKEYLLNRIVLWNRTDCCPWRLSNFRISILDAAAAEVVGMDFFTDLSFPDTAVAGFEYQLPPGVAGQFVRLDKLGPDSQGTMYLSLAEVQVFSSAADISPAITRQPRGGKGFAGGSFTFSVEATGSDPLTTQWKKGGDELPGATSSALVLNPLKLEEAGVYTVEVKNNAGAAESDPAALKVFKGRNLARDGEASQSSLGFGGLPARAIDGNTDGNYFDNSVSHTASGDPNPWWEVQLFGPSGIAAIYVWNRTDCCPERLSNFRVSVLDSNRSEVFGDDLFTDGTYPDTRAEGFEILTAPPAQGQVVRVELLGAPLGPGFYVSLAEVEVLGEGPEPPPDPNLARRPGATATQSSEAGGGLYPASNAIDGILDDFTHTGAGLNLPATWEVDLNGAHDIEEIVIWNRRDCCGSRLRDITVSILNSAGDAALFTSELLNPENALGAYPDGPEKLALNLFNLTGGDVSGGKVRIVRTPDDDLSGTGGQGNPDEMDVLSLAEVQVFTTVPCPQEGDTHCVAGSLKVEGPQDGGPGMYAVSARGQDDSGDAVRYTFTADNGAAPPAVVGPQLAPQTNMLLGIGNWTISVTADDHLRCPDAAPDATCSTPIEVKGKPNNQAPYGAAAQSSTYFGAEASRAIDGITDGNYGLGSVSHTDTGDPAPWWEVELEETFDLERIVIWNRTDCCPERLTNFKVSVLAADRGVNHEGDFFTDLTYPDTTTDGFEIKLPAGTKGKIVWIELLPGGSSYLSLAEVEVYSRTAPPTQVFKRGDVDNSGAVDISDPINELHSLFLGDFQIACRDAADFDDSGEVDISDAINSLLWRFGGGPPAPPPGSAACGEDLTADQDPNHPGGNLGCELYDQCP